MSTALSERSVTDDVAAIGGRDTGFAIRLARALLSTATEQEGKPGDRAQNLLRHVPTRRLELASEKHVPHDGFFDEVVRDIRRSRIDWLFTGDLFSLAVEVKTNRRTDFGPGQLENYHRALKKADSPIARPYAGLLALVPIPPFKDALISARRRRFFLGAILWEEAGPALRAIRPSDPDDASRWTEILDAVL